MLSERMKTQNGELRDTLEQLVEDLTNHKLDYIKSTSHMKGDFADFKE